jgi:hypothetical protein
MSAASARLIQSPAEVATQSSFGAEELLPPDTVELEDPGPVEAVPVAGELPEVALPSEPLAVLASSLLCDFEARLPDELLDDRRSTFAQPEPLNTIAGFENALRIVPSAPHSGQKRGPESLIPWITSVVRAQLVQV